MNAMAVMTAAAIDRRQTQSTEARATRQGV
jgi:hypothetical protein